MVPSTPALCGLVLAAGAGIRFGGPKALVLTPEGESWTALAVGMLQRAGCREVLVALGAASDEAGSLVPAGARIVRVERWRDGLGATLQAAIAAASDLAVDALLITPVDTPDAPAAAAERVLAEASGAASASDVLARAVFAGRPGHPVLIGRAHWARLTSTLVGDAGAGRYLTANDALAVECGDLWSGADVDRR